MPTYEYVCTNPECGHTFAQVQAFTDDALAQCPVCGGRLRKIFGSVGVVFKGSGFYRTDSRAESKNGAAKPETAEPKKKAESTPAADGKSVAKAPVAKSETASSTAAVAS
jgi:putative FmdB family regulatory protein